MSDPSSKSAASLLGDLLHHLANLLAKEFRLLRLELAEKLGQVAVALGLLLAGLICALTAIIVLADALVAAVVALGLPHGFAALLVGLAIALLGFLLIQVGLAKLKATSLKPERSLRSLRKAAAAVEETMK